jgi:hypothetical protein
MPGGIGSAGRVAGKAHLRGKRPEALTPRGAQGYGQTNLGSAGRGPRAAAVVQHRDGPRLGCGDQNLRPRAATFGRLLRLLSPHAQSATPRGRARYADLGVLAVVHGGDRRDARRSEDGHPVAASPLPPARGVPRASGSGRPGDRRPRVGPHEREGRTERLRPRLTGAVRAWDGRGATPIEGLVRQPSIGAGS